MNTLFSKTLRDVALPMECCGKAAAFVQRRRLVVKGHCRIVRWCVNTLFGNTLRDVALRAIELTGASARRLFAATTFGGKGPLPNCAVMCEHVG